jgi:peptidoglycan hydrolase-like protein with peptidoglycan-binding domain
MYTEERSLNNETMALVADTTPQSSLGFAETTRVNKPTLQIGSTGQAVTELQQLLYHWGYYFGPMDGIFGVQVQNAVKGYQHRVFLKEDGIVGSITKGSTILWCTCEYVDRHEGQFGQCC